jgi:hypothetical protein
MKHKCVKLNSFLKRKMAAYLRQQTHSQISQSEAFLFLGLFDKTNFTSSYTVPEKDCYMYK